MVRSPPPTRPINKDWRNLETIKSRKYVCGYCNSIVGSDKGFYTYVPDNPDWGIYICSNCHRPTFFDYEEIQTPGASFGNEINHLPPDVKTIYDEARFCISANAFTASVLSCRKLLMHIAVEKGAEAGKSFASYVDFFQQNHYIPPDGAAWVDIIRRKGNEANHEISVMNVDDAKELLKFVEMLLKFIYEYPEEGRQKASQK